MGRLIFGRVEEAFHDTLLGGPGEQLVDPVGRRRVGRPVEELMVIGVDLVLTVLDRVDEAQGDLRLRRPRIELRHPAGDLTVAPGSPQHGVVERLDVGGVRVRARA